MHGKHETLLGWDVLGSTLKCCPQYLRVVFGIDGWHELLHGLAYELIIGIAEDPTSSLIQLSDDSDI